MKKALLCATAAATMVSGGAIAHAQEGWYGVGKIGAAFDGIQDVDAERGSNSGQIDANLTPKVSPVFGLGLGYGFGGGFRAELVGNYRNTKMLVPPTFLGVQPPATLGPEGAGSTRVTTLMANVIKDFNFGGNVKPYIGIGAGGARVDSHVSSLYSIPSGLQANGFDDTDTKFGWNALLGVGIQVSEQLVVDIGYTYTNVDEPFRGGDLSFDGLDGDYGGRWTSMR